MCCHVCICGREWTYYIILYQCVREHVAACKLLPSYSPFTLSLTAPVSSTPFGPSFGPAVSVSFDGCCCGLQAAASPPPLVPTPSFLWRPDRPGGPARAEFGSSDENDAQSLCASLLGLYMQVIASRTVSCLGFLPFWLQSLPKQRILYLCQCSAVTHGQSNIFLIDWWAFV